MEPPVPNLVGHPHHPCQHTIHHGIPVSESVESSPKSTTHHHDWDDPLPPVPGAKLRLMCSYGGHIIPRPHDKTLCYVGGETRIVVAERNSSLSELTARLSHTLLDDRKFTLKYQLPNEDLDSLISVSNDEDLENMIEEYDRIAAANAFSKPASSRLRLFLFLAKPDTAQTMGALLDDAQSETWFVEALNGADVLSRGLSESAVVGDLLRLDSSASEHALQLPDIASNLPPNASLPQDVHSIQSVMSDSPMVETGGSSFDSSTSSPSMAHLPPIRVRMDELNDGNTRMREVMKEGVALEEQFSSQLRVTPPSTATLIVSSATVDANDSSSKCGVPDEEGLSEHGMPVVSRKPPLPLHIPIPVMQHRINGGFNLASPNEPKHSAGFNLASPDSVSSFSSIASGISLTKVPTNQDQTHVTTLNENKVPITQHTIEQKSEPQNQNLQLQPTHQDTTKYIYTQQHPDQHQHQFIQDNMHYIPTHSAIPSYRPVYATQQQMRPQLDHQQYSMYLLPVTQTQPYNVAQPTPMASLVPPSSVAHSQPPVYPTRAATTPANNQFQQYVGYNAALQPMAGNTANYGHFDYGHNQVYYTGQLAPTASVPMAASQYQSITPAQAAMIAEASLKLPSNTADCTKQPHTS